MNGKKLQARGKPSNGNGCIQTLSIRIGNKTITPELPSADYIFLSSIRKDEDSDKAIRQILGKLPDGEALHRFVRLMRRVARQHYEEGRYDSLRSAPHEP